MHVAQFVHERIPKRRTSIFQKLGANRQFDTRLRVSSSPSAHVRKQWDELNGGFRQTVNAFLPMMRIRTPRKKARRRQAFQSIRENIRGNALFALPEQFAIRASVSKHDVTNDNQTPTITKLFERQVNRAARTTRLLHKIFFTMTTCKTQVPLLGSELLANCK